VIEGMLPWLRSLAGEYRPDTCTIQRAAESVTSGGVTQTFATLASGVTCRVSRIGQGGSEGLGANGATLAVGQRRIKLPTGQDVTPKDCIVVSGVTYEVADVQSVSNEVETTAICREVV
jgi:hypothetical protein